jgi:hypothetical protein
MVRSIVCAMPPSRFEQITTPHRTAAEGSDSAWAWLYAGFTTIVAVYLSFALVSAKEEPVVAEAATPSPRATALSTPTPAPAALPANLESQLKLIFKQAKLPVIATNLKSTPQELIWSPPVAEIFVWDLRRLLPRSQLLLRNLALHLKKTNLRLEIEGPALPVRGNNARLGNDWELSTLQAARIADFLVSAQAPVANLQVLAGKSLAPNQKSVSTLHFHFLLQPTSLASPTPVATAKPQLNSAVSARPSTAPTAVIPRSPKSQQLASPRSNRP